MISPPVSLSAEERDLAQTLWSLLMAAPTQAKLQTARAALEAAPAAVREAVTHAIVGLWSQGQNAQSTGNPFD